MKKTMLFSLLGAAAMLLSACSQTDQPVQSSQPEVTQSQDYQTAVSELTLLDGSAASDDEIISFEKADRFNQSTTDRYTVNVCFCVPFHTPSNKRTAFESGNWVKLKAGSEIKGFTVEKAEASYFQPIESEDGKQPLFLPEKLEQNVTLKGDFSCTGKAYKDLAPDGGETGGIVIELDDSSLKSFFSLKPALKTTGDYKEFDDTDKYFESEEGMRFYINDETEGFQQVMDKLSDTENVNVKLEADGFRLRYTFETGTVYDGMNVGYTDGGAVSLA